MTGLKLWGQGGMGKIIGKKVGDTCIMGPQLYYSFFHTLVESSSYWRTICGLELCFVVFVFNNQCFDFIGLYCVNYYQKSVKVACNYF